MEFEPEEFLKDVTWEKFDGLKKPDLMALAKYYSLGVKQETRKQVVKNGLIDVLVDEEILDESCLGKKVEILTEIARDAVQLKQLEIEMEKIKLEKEIRLEQQKLELKRLESETHLKELEIQAKYKSESDSSPSSSAHRSQPCFDASRYIKLVPKFTEIEVDKYFQHFEKVAANMKWPKEVCTLLLQNSFVGKAREVYSALLMEKSENYDEVKQAILKAYELVPEAYRQKFRGLEKMIIRHM
ncbi:putative zinc finger protein [Apostichopus japonicus]|uniref:Putative zinc finger protein n=1 Tax=Stichopus japonicus TaxID=307972 RepID=A0A2G8LHG7_STIJA|nr:putative zinc finger protein [Apostichopus japonicus]